VSVIFSTEHLAKKAGKPTEVERPDAHAALWEKHRELMRTLTLGVDIAYLHNLREWGKAETVLEIGSGRGKFLEQLIEYFPEKEYVGLDTSKKAKEASATSGRPGTISIVSMALSDMNPSHFERYDIIFVHSFSQNIASPQAFLKQVYRLLKPGGSVILYEMNDEKIAFRPDPGFGAFFDELPGLREVTSRHFCLWKDLVRSANGVGFSILAHSDVLFPSSYGDNKRHLGKIVSQLLEIAEHSGEMEWNFASARRALSRWSGDSSSFGQFAIHRLVLRRPGGWLRRLFGWLF